MANRFDGYDIYHGNVITDITKVPAVPVMAHKLSEGATSQDPLAAQRLPMLPARLKLGYHWTRPDATADTQFANFLDALRKSGLLDGSGGLKPFAGVMDDWERSYDTHGNALPFPTFQLAEQIRYLIRNRFGNRLITYSAPWVAGFNTWRILHPGDGLWLADYSANDLADAHALNAVCVQYTDHQVVAGFAKPVDGSMILQPGPLDQICGVPAVPPIITTPPDPTPTPPTQPPTPPSGDDMKIGILRLHDSYAVFSGPAFQDAAGNWVLYQVKWVKSDQLVALDAQKAAGHTVEVVPDNAHPDVLFDHTVCLNMQVDQLPTGDVKLLAAPGAWTREMVGGVG